MPAITLVDIHRLDADARREQIDHAGLLEIQQHLEKIMEGNGEFLSFLRFPLPLLTRF